MHTRLLTIASVLATTVLASATDWPQWHGPTRDCRVPGNLTTLPKELAPKWSIKVGGGHSSPVVANGRLIYFDENGSKEIAHCLDAKTGKELWRAEIAGRFEDEWGAGTRATPFIDGDRVYAQSCNGEFRCLALADGKPVWGVSFEKDFGVKFLGSKANSGTAARRGNNGTGLVDGPHVIIPVGSTEGATLVCFDKLTGKVIWKVGSEEAAYSAPMVATLAGVKQVVYLSATSLMGVDRATGKLLWRVPLKTNANRHAASPVIEGNTVTVNSHTFGTLCFRIVKDSSGFKAESAWANKELQTNLATPASLGGYFYNQGAKKDYVCLDAKTGEVKWSQPGFGGMKQDYASTLIVGDKVLVLTYDGQLVLLANNPAKYTELARLQVCGSSWSYPAYADGKLYVRDNRELKCVELAAK
ncbi:MAG: PQQ-binding-like beta-propeller repeat protein [Verrucomicrobia bacterium]|nr:PQQ-binding-like beta-propeller repeat protein [Verrucomicrobiota bacterium]